MSGESADRVVLSYPADVGKHGRKRLHQDYYRGWLRKNHDAVAVGDEWDEFTDVGCCGSRMDLPLRVEAVDGGSHIGPETAIEYTEREACGVNPGWSVQHDEPDPVRD
ncbi:MAG: hypothetical protein V5A28_07905 [Haloarculaceae archaeon]